MIRKVLLYQSSMHLLGVYACGGHSSEKYLFITYLGLYLELRQK